MTTEELHLAYRAALYRVDLPSARLQLRVDTPSEPLRQWMQAQGHVCAALLTAHNPGSQPCDAATNQNAQQRLHHCLQERGWVFYVGCNRDPLRLWPEEDSVLIVDLPLPQAHDLALHFGQLAFLWCDTSAVPRLHLAVSQTAQPT